jgi:molybdopterin/thiamine biosynthesis adenylyltransferase
MVASLQCMEALKLLIGKGSDLSGSLLRIHGLGMRIRKTVIARDPRCRACSPN